MANIRYYFTSTRRPDARANQWDLLAFFIIFGVIFTLAWAAKQMATPYQLGDPLSISLDPSYLPFYVARSVLRMGIALCFSLLFTFTVGTWAAKNPRAEKIIIPAIDILQAVPVLSFLSITIVGFIHLFPNSLLGPECAAIFAIFTAQAWNMALGFYQTVRSVPADLIEAADVYHLSAWQRFWKIEVPFSMSSLLWNTMMSLSASWFFVVASEAISVSNQKIRLPGVGSYIAVAIERADMHAVFYAIASMLIVILMYDQLLFRPLIKWSEKFNLSDTPQDNTSFSWFLSLLQKTALLSYVGSWFSKLSDAIIHISFLNRPPVYIDKKPSPLKSAFSLWFWRILMTGSTVLAIYLLINFIIGTISYGEIGHVFMMGVATSIRVFVLIILSSLVWVPVGVWVGRRPHVTQAIQPVVQFLAAFPANLLFPVFVMMIVHYHLNVNIWLTPLMILGSQWYILFNVVAGANNIPKDLYQAADNLNVRGWQWWRRLALPGIFPYFITGAITAAGGAWNASIVAEYVSWGNTTLRATGLGEYIAAYTATGDFHRIALGTGMMCLFVLIFNRIVWRPLYRLAQERYQIA
jgi:NitT/TauT family transport system permease protein